MADTMDLIAAAKAELSIDLRHNENHSPCALRGVFARAAALEAETEALNTDRLRLADSLHAAELTQERLEAENAQLLSQLRALVARVRKRYWNETAEFVCELEELLRYREAVAPPAPPGDQG